MEALLGITGKGYTIIASDNNAARSIVKMKSDDDKQKELSDTIQFSDYVERNMRLYAIRNNIQLRPRAAAAWIRTQIAESLRSRKPYQVNMLLGGYDAPSNTPELYWLDYLGTLVQVPYAAQGYAAYLTTSTMDRYHRPDMSLDQGLDLLKRCIDELQKRLVIDVGSFTVRVIDQHGVRKVALP